MEKKWMEALKTKLVSVRRVLSSVFYSNLVCKLNNELSHNIQNVEMPFSITP